jgi:flagellar basal body-associated protein FliL
MPEADEVKQEAEGGTAAPGPKGKLMTVLVVAGLMLVEGAGIFLGVRMLYSKPAESKAAEEPKEPAEPLAGLTDDAEIALPEISAFNKQDGRLYLFSIQVTVRVRKDKVEEFKKIIEARQSTLLDRFNTVVRSADLKYLNEPGLDTLRRQFKFELDKVVGESDSVTELLIPKFFQSPANL